MKLWNLHSKYQAMHGDGTWHFWKKKLLIACLPTKHIGVRVRAFQIELEFESVGFRGAKEQQQTQPTSGVDVRLSRTGRRELSPLRHPLLSNKG